MPDLDLFKTPEEIVEQRAKGWTDWHPEDYCHKCGQRNIKPWYADSALWNKAAPPHVIWCPQCFVEAYEEATGEHLIWRLAPEEFSDQVSSLIQSEAAMRHERDAYAAQLERYDGQAWEDLLAERDTAERRAEAVEQAVARARAVVDEWDGADPSTPNHHLWRAIRAALDGPAAPEGASDG